MKINELKDVNLWELAVLCLLHEGPMHPYEMQSLIRTRRKDEVLVLKKGSLYHAIGRLERGSLIEALEVSRNGKRPERTTYKITTAGEKELLRWLEHLIATPAREPSQFMASLSFLVYLSPTDALLQLKQRVELLEKELISLQQAMDRVSHLPRIHLLEVEYIHAMRNAELQWVRSLINDLQSGSITWNLEELLENIRAEKKQKQEVRL